MKKILALAAVILVLGYVLYQNDPVWLLKILSLQSGSGANISSGTTVPSSNPPYKDGTYTGSVADAFYGIIQVQATIANGRITNIQFLQAPNDRQTSVMINRQADPMLAQEAIQTQNANVDIVSGATDSSNAFIQSLQSALNRARG